MGLVLMVDPWAKHVDFSGGAAFELRGGSAPPAPSLAPVPTMRLTISPRGTMTYRDRVRGRQVSLDVAPQMFYSLFPDKKEYSDIPARPLFFGQATLRYAGDLGPRWSWQGSAGASYGEQDYSLQSGGLVQGDGSTADATDPAQGSLVSKAIIQTGGVSAGVGLTGRLTPLHTLSFGPRVTLQRRLDEPEPGQVSLDQTSGALDVSHAWVASRVDTVGSRISGGYADFGPVNGSQAFGSADVVWSRRLRPRLDGQLLAGLFITKQVRARTQGSLSPSSARSLPLMPIANVGLSGRLLQRSRLRISTNVNAGSQAYFDPVQGSVLPLTGGGASFDFFLPPDLTVGLATTFYTPPTRPTDFEYRYAYLPSTARTTLTARTPVTYTIDRNHTIEVGTIVNARGPNLRTGIPQIDRVPAPETIEGIDLQDIVFDPWRFTQTEFWVYVAFRLNYTTQRAERS